MPYIYIDLDLQLYIKTIKCMSIVYAWLPSSETGRRSTKYCITGNLQRKDLLGQAIKSTS